MNHWLKKQTRPNATASNAKTPPANAKTLPPSSQKPKFAQTKPQTKPFSKTANPKLTAVAAPVASVVNTPENAPPENRFWLSKEKADTIIAYVGPKGYTIIKSSLDAKTLTQLKTALQARPQTGGPVPSRVVFPIFRETTDKIFIPYYYALNTGFPVHKAQSYLPSGAPISVHFDKPLLPRQVPILETFLQHIQTQTEMGAPIRGGMLELPCGWGKTAGALYCVSKIGKRVLVICNQNELVDQWIDRTKVFLPNASIGRIQGDVFDIDKDIVFAMINTLCSRTFPPGAFQTFGVLVVDEAHFIGSTEFSKALTFLTIPITIGLSATMRRPDGMIWMIQQFLGPVICKAERDDVLIDVQIRAIYYQPPVMDSDFMAPILNSCGDLMMSSMISKICKYPPYRECVLEKLREFIRVKEWTPTLHELWMNTWRASLVPCCYCGNGETQLVRTTCCKETTHCFTCLDKFLNPPNKEDILARLISSLQSTRSEIKQKAQFIGKIPGCAATCIRFIKGADIQASLIEFMTLLIEHCPSFAKTCGKSTPFLTSLLIIAAQKKQHLSHAPEVDMIIRVLHAQAVKKERENALQCLVHMVDAGYYPALRAIQEKVAPEFPFEFCNYYSGDLDENVKSEDKEAPSFDSPLTLPLQKEYEELVYLLDGKKCPCCKARTKIGLEQNYMENELVEPYGKRQTIVFANCRQILLDMYKTIIENNWASVGLYIGNTTDTREIKKKKLKEAEHKQIILATYSMAGTGLDIPSLNAAFFVTSKADIEQPAGRPMRKVHEYPTVIYDFVWPHPCFKRQYTGKRRAYYKKNNYSITETKMPLPSASSSLSSSLISAEYEDEEDVDDNDEELLETPGDILKRAACIGEDDEC